MAASDEMESTRLETDANAVVTELQHTHTHTHIPTTKEGQPCVQLCNYEYVTVSVSVSVCVPKSQLQFSINVATTPDTFNDEGGLGRKGRTKLYT